MKPQRGYYSLIQFCPDASRLEAVNVGVVLFCPAVEFLRARTSSNNRRAEKLVGRDNIERGAINAAKQAIEKRLEVDRDSFKSIEDLERYVDTRANWLRLTKPRSVKVFTPEVDLEKLYAELVGGKSRQQSKTEKQEVFKALHESFAKFVSEGRAQTNLKVNIPVVEKELKVPFAYQNGQMNLVIPQIFSRKASLAKATAMLLAAEGNLVGQYGIASGNSAQLIVVSSFEDEGNAEVTKEIKSTFEHFKVSNIPNSKIDAFIAKVDQEASLADKKRV